MSSSSSDARHIVAELTAARSRGRFADRRLWAVVVLIAAAAAGAWWWMQPAAATNDPRVVEVVEMQKEVQRQFFPTGRDAANSAGYRGPATPQQAEAMIASMTAVREKIDALPEPLRNAAERQTRSLFWAAMQARINDYFETPANQRQALLDRHIRESDLMRQAWEAQRAATETDADRAAREARRNSRTEETRNAWRKRIIDRTTPEQRARYTEYRTAMEKRREELGIEPPRRPGR